MKIKRVVLFAILIGMNTVLAAKTKLPTLIKFTVQAPAKEITGICRSAHVWIDKTKGSIEATIPVDSVNFSNNFTSADMNDVIRERFRDYYMEAEEYPVVSFDGKFHPDSLRMSLKDENQHLPIYGKLRIHGVSRDIEMTAHVIKRNGRQMLITTIVILPNNYGVKVPPYIGKMYFSEVAIEVEAAL